MSALPSVTSIRTTYKQLVAAHPDAHCELDHENPFQLIVATALSAQSTDVQVNKVTPGLFAAYPTPSELGDAQQEDVEQLINRLGMYRQKAKNLIGMARALVRDHAGEVPSRQEDLVRLPGVGRKTANVVLGVAFSAPVGVVVDTHVQRITQRLGWTEHGSPEKIERDLMRLLPQSEWDRVSHTLIFHGRRICDARKPACSTCPVHKRCPSAFNAVNVGRKPKKNVPQGRVSKQVGASRPAQASAAKKTTTKKTTAKKTTTKKTTTKKAVAASSAPSPSKKAQAGKASSKKTAQSRTAGTRKNSGLQAPPKNSK